MKLYDIARSSGGTWVRVLEDMNGPPASPDFKADDVVLFYHVDGMYSLCRNRGGELVHLKAWTEVELIGKGEVK
jgi:hypothetical protein